jgi:hypothetical protein
MDDKYQVEELEQVDDSNDVIFKASMTIMVLETHDHYDKYYLEVENSLGVQKYFFEVDVEGGDGGGGKLGKYSSYF